MAFKGPLLAANYMSSGIPAHEQFQTTIERGWPSEGSLEQELEKRLEQIRAAMLRNDKTETYRLIGEKRAFAEANGIPQNEDDLLIPRIHFRLGCFHDFDRMVDFGGATSDLFVEKYERYLGAKFVKRDSKA